jgi:hypothetical protein
MFGDIDKLLPSHNTRHMSCLWLCRHIWVCKTRVVSGSKRHIGSGHCRDMPQQLSMRRGIVWGISLSGTCCCGPVHHSVLTSHLS